MLGNSGVELVDSSACQSVFAAAKDRDRSRAQGSKDRSVSVKFDSPLRYPGGKAALAPFLAKTIALNGLAGCAYYEPFAGGAGAALRLLREEAVSCVHINDRDPRIAAFWRAAVKQSERFAAAIMSVKLNVQEWKRQREVYLGKDPRKPFELGFATFYLNRCNRSGVLFGAAPIGGYEQAGKWKRGARFYRESLAERVAELGRRANEIHISNMDAGRFLVENLPRGHGRCRVFAYLDPPYWEKGGRLYFNSYSPKDHSALAHYMQRQRALKWVASYDDAQEIREMYASSSISPLSLRYSLCRVRGAREILITPEHLQLPAPELREDTQAWTTN